MKSLERITWLIISIIAFTLFFIYPIILYRLEIVISNNGFIHREGALAILSWYTFLIFYYKDRNW